MYLFEVRASQEGKDGHRSQLTPLYWETVGEFSTVQ
jgi:hypothetical protein